MVSDSVLVNRLCEILSSADLDTTTAGSIRRQLEEEFGISLNDRKAFIREQIDIFLQPRNDDPQQHLVEQEEEVYDEDNNGDKVEESENVKEEEIYDNESQEEEEEQDEQEEEENDGETIKKNRSEEMDKKVKRKGSGFSKPCALSPQLQELVGVPELARTEVVRKIWVYIREKNLQNPMNKKKIICDKTLRAIFKVDSVDMFKMNKLLSKHIWPVDTEDESKNVKQEEIDDNGSQEEEEKQDEQEEEESDGETIKKKRSDEMDKKVKRKGSGFSKPCALSPQLQELVGVPELARTEVVRKIWVYIREKNLQNPMNKKKIICDKTLRAIFQVDSVDMFKMNKLLSKHIWPIDTDDVKSSSKERQKKQGRLEDEPKQKGKRQKQQTSGFLAPVPLSDALVEFFGTGEDALPRADVVKRMWQYIKGNELQDPTDKRIIICDDKLKELFKTGSFHGFTMTKLLSSHFIKSD